MKKLADRYLKTVEWSEEDQCYIGRCPGLMLGGVHGDDELSVYKELCEVVEEWIEIHQKDEIPLPEATSALTFSGELLLKVGEEIHRKLTIRALQNGETVNHYCKKLLSQYA
jgi:predicted HicB family RNase H-like nuclease